MTHITNFFLGILLIATQIACDTTTTVDLPKKNQRLTLNCIAQDNSPWQVNLSLSKGILEVLPFDGVFNATVDIYENDKLVESVIETTDFEGRYFFQNSFPTPGKSYRIEAKAQPYGTVSAFFKQPLPVIADALEVKILGTNPAFEFSRDAQFRVFLTDPPGDNYYAISITRKSEDSAFPGSAALLNLAFIDPAYRQNNEPYSATLTYKDTYFDGQKTYLDLKSIISDYPDERPLNFYSVTLKNLTKEHYDYLKTSYLQNSTRNDPFAQPIQVVNNINNGFGIFAGFTQTVFTVEFPN